MKRWLTLALMLALLPGTGLAAPAVSRPISKYTDAYFSTASVLSLYTDSAAFEEIWGETKEILALIDASVSVSKPDSDIARFNALASGESCEISDITAEIFLLAREIWAETDGLYDPTVYPLVDLWGFSPRFNSNQYTRLQPYDRDYAGGILPLPEEGYIQAFLSLVGLDGVELTGQKGAWRLIKRTPDVTYGGVVWHAQMDLGGIAKGYACDRVARLVREHGCEEGYFACGGSSLSILKNARGDGSYEMTVHKPRPGKTADSDFASLRVADAGLSTSSDQNHCFLSDGFVYCHIIDPRTGWPVNKPDASGTQRGIVSVTLLAKSAARCDALTTAIMLMGPEDALSFLNQHPDLQCLFVLAARDRDSYEIVSNLSSDELTITDPAYRLVSTLTENGACVYSGELFGQSAAQ